MMAIMVGGTVMRDATGNVTDLWTTYNSSLLALSMPGADNDTAIENSTVIETVTRTSWSIYGTDFNCTTGCKYGTHNSFEVHKIINTNYYLQMRLKFLKY